MFAQLVITLLIVWLIAEALCRIVFRSSLAAAARELFSLEDPPEADSRAAATPPVVEPHATLSQLLKDRRRSLVETEERLALARETADVSERLAVREADLELTEQRLAEVEQRRRA